ncbi:hypothetical protein GI364_08625 [Alicyclobacillus sp. SO9]|nr:hypothetical protein GI364_08625 [Alicyclobacillus sp. SO9]
MFQSLDYYLSQFQLGRKSVLTSSFFGDDNCGVMQLSFRNHEINQIYRQFREDDQSVDFEGRFLEALVDSFRFVLETQPKRSEIAHSLHQYISAAFES